MNLEISSSRQYYYQQLNKKDRIIYCQFIDGISSFLSSVIIECENIDKIQHIYECVEFDNPLIFFVKGLSYTSNQSISKIKVMLQYRFEKSVTSRILESIKNRVKLICMTWRNLSDNKKEELVHGYLVNYVVYDTNFSSASFEVVGPVQYGKGVCEGISKTVKLMFDYLEIDCIVVLGRERRTNSNYSVDLHAWNIVRLNGYYYHLDITFDMTIMTEHVERFDYYNLSDKKIGRDHVVLSLSVPLCVHDYEYYTKKNSFMKTPGDLRHLLKLVKNRGMNDIVFQLPFTKDFEYTREKVLNVVQESLNTYTYRQEIMLYYNSSQYVFHLHFK